MSRHWSVARFSRACGVPVCMAWTILFSSTDVCAQALTPPPAWTIDASINTCVLPDEGNYMQPALAADRGWLHLDARVNYEDLTTGSIRFGYNFSGGETFAWTVTRVLGGVFGQIDGVADRPGLQGREQVVHCLRSVACASA